MRRGSLRCRPGISQAYRYRVRGSAKETERSVAMRKVWRKAEDSSRKATPTGKEGLLDSAADTSRLSLMRTKRANG